jgi:hypothetical protein
MCQQRISIEGSGISGFAPGIKQMTMKWLRNGIFLAHCTCKVQELAVHSPKLMKMKIMNSMTQVSDCVVLLNKVLGEEQNTMTHAAILNHMIETLHITA